MLWVQLIVQGFLLGSLYMLLSLGLNAVYGILKAVNYAHGTFVMLGAYTAYWLFVLFGINPYISVVLAALLSALIGALGYELFVKPFIGRPNFGSIALITTYGLALVLINTARYLWTDVLRGIRLVEAPISIGDISISRPYLYGGCIAIGIAIIFYFFIEHTRLGKAIRATSQDRIAAMLMSINTDRLSRLVYTIGVGLGGAAGALISPIFAISPEGGAVLGLKAIMVVIIGGLGSYIGCVIGGLLLGFSEVFGAFLLGASNQPLIYLLTFAIVLALRPSGIMGEK
ncbi:MAG: branched-chain amino acid ABC transporter permease [Candidatus Verstraetearchaeota archaeon]|nr:branched-chain amino acid ABC transporter permease [Candidatus Verstraetearchaeota archaeon]